MKTNFKYTLVTMPYNILMCVHIYYSPLTPRPKFQEVETDRLSHLPKATQLVRGFQLLTSALLT
jgi:hypothetical protein